MISLLVSNDSGGEGKLAEKVEQELGDSELLEASL